MQERAVAEPRSSQLILVLFVLALFVVSAFFIFARGVLNTSTIDAARFFGGAVPSRLKTLQALSLEQGSLAELYDSSNYHKVSLLFADHSQTEQAPLSVPDVIQKLDRARLDPAASSELSELIRKYANAQINVLSAGNVAATEVPVAGTSVLAQRFTTTRQANYLIGVLNLADAQLLFLFLRKGEAVDSLYAGQILGELAQVKARVSQVRQ